MNKLTELIITKAYAQGGGFGTGSSNRSTFTVSDFTFLSPFKNTSFDTLLGNLIGVVLTIAAIVAFAYLLFAGFQYITAGGDAAKATGARTAIVNALIGVIVILIAYVVLRYVGTNLLGNDNSSGGF